MLSIEARTRRGTRLGSAVIALACVWTVAAGASERASARPFLKGIADPIFLSSDAQARNHWLDESTRAGSGLIRINMSWRSVVSGQPAQPTDPADPAYNFGPWDEAIGAATSRGMQVFLTIFDAPDFAEAKNQPQNPDGLHPEGTFRPDPRAFGDFGEAVARRYSGAFTTGGVLETPTLPEVRYYEAWNEPNLSLHLNPQWRGMKNTAAPNYRRMLNAFYEAVKRGNPNAQVITAGLAPFGDDPPNDIRTRPLRFLRELLCLKPEKLKPDRCKTPPKFDILAHHPIQVHGGPRRSSINPDDASGAVDFKNVERTLRYAERKNTVAGGRHSLWATEFWWQTNPPDKELGYRLNQQARFIEEALYLLHKYGASAGVILQIVDAPGKQQGLQTGLFFADGSPKPSFQAFRFPFVADRKSKRKLTVWTIPPTSGELLVEEKNGSGYGTVASGQATAGEVLTDTLNIKGKVTLRATVNGEQSLAWTEGGSGKKGKRTEGDGKKGKRMPRYAPQPDRAEGPAPIGVPVPQSLAPYVESVPAP